MDENNDTQQPKVKKQRIVRDRQFLLPVLKELHRDDCKTLRQEQSFYVKEWKNEFSDVIDAQAKLQKTNVPGDNTQILEDRLTMVYEKVAESFVFLSSVRIGSTMDVGNTFQTFLKKVKNEPDKLVVVVSLGEFRADYGKG